MTNLFPRWPGRKTHPRFVTYFPCSGVQRELFLADVRNTLLSKKGEEKKKRQLEVTALLTLLPEYFVLADEELAFFSLVGAKFLTLLGGTFCCIRYNLVRVWQRVCTPEGHRETTNQEVKQEQADEFLVHLWF